MYTPQGIIHVTGEPDTGKTLLALTAFHPKKVAYFFDDVKRPPIDDKEFGLFIDLVEKYSSLKMLEFYKAFIAEVNKIKDNQYDAIVFDTWARIGKSIRYYAKANPLEFREGATFSRQGTIKGMEEWSETHRVESDVISALSRKCKALFLITHIKPQIKAGVQTGTFEPDCGKSFERICNMRLWLRHNPESGVPISLVLKRLSKVEVTKTGVVPVNVLPRKLVPQKENSSVWDVINHYWDNPVGNREPLPDEIPNDFELSILDGILTDSQKEMWQAELRERERQEKEEAEMFEAQLAIIKQEAINLAAQITAPLPVKVSQVYNELIKEYPNISYDDIERMLK